jgi:DNA-binding response OmpR family regulator
LTIRESLAKTLSVTALRVLVVDDSQDGADMLASVLELRGHVVDVAYDAAAALRIAAERRPAVGIVDLGLPGMNGLDLATAIRALPGLASITLIALTAWDEKVAEAAAAGFDMYMVKPADLRLLEATLVAIANSN